jgi:hypothetical protein
VLGDLFEFYAPEFSGRIRWVGYFACGALLVLAALATHVFNELSTVRPLLVFVSVGGEMPPVCGFCVLFGR